jgi:adenylate cyclase
MPLMLRARRNLTKYTIMADLEKIAEELGVRYVLEGSVQRSENQVRITAQLIDAVSGNHLWAERYDRDIKDIFVLQDEITMKIVTALQVKLTEGDQAYMWSRQTDNIDVYLKFMESFSSVRKGTREGIMRMGQLGKEIVDMAPDSVVGYRVLGWYNNYLAGMGVSSKKSIEKAFELAKKGLSIDESNSSIHALLSNLYLKTKQYEKAIEVGKRSIELDPNGAMVHGVLGITLSYTGRTDEAIGYLKKGIRLNPFPGYWYYENLGRCYRHKGEYESALTFFEKAAHLAPGSLRIQMQLASVYALLGRQKEAEIAAKKVLEIDPDFSLTKNTKLWPNKNQAHIKLFLDALRKAGLPD